MNERGTFALWMTGLPAAGKSTVTKELVSLLHHRNIFPVVLESDALRRVLTPDPAYTPEERDRFYRQMALLGELITQCGVPVIFDATANLRAYRALARSRIPRFLEVLLDTPIDLCMTRDPKGLYAAAASGATAAVPGLQAPYERPLAPELVLDGMTAPPRAADLIIDLLITLRYI